MGLWLSIALLYLQGLEQFLAHIWFFQIICWMNKYQKMNMWIRLLFLKFKGISSTCKTRLLPYLICNLLCISFSLINYIWFTGEQEFSYFQGNLIVSNKEAKVKNLCKHYWRQIIKLCRQNYDFFWESKPGERYFHQIASDWGPFLLVDNIHVIIT